MNELTYPIKYNEDYRVVTANELIRGRQKMTLIESRLFAITVSQIVKEDKNLKTYTTTIPELAIFTGVSEENLYRDIESICARLVGRIVKIPVVSNGEIKGFRIFHLIGSAEYISGILTLRISDDIKPYLLELDKNYSQPLLGTLMSFRSYYSSRLYQYLLSESKQFGKWEWEFSCDELRDIFHTYEVDNSGKVVKEQYKINGDLLKKTLLVALKELHLSEYGFVYNYEEIRKRKAGSRGKASVVGAKFSVLFYETAEEKEKSVENILERFPDITPLKVD